MSKISEVKVGDVIEITPIEKVPNCERKFRVDEVLKDGFLYGLSETCDGWLIPFNWIKSLEIVERGK